MNLKQSFVKKLFQKKKYTTECIIRVVNQTVTLPDGRESKREVVHHSGAIAVLALTDDDKMILERQWRAPVQKVTTEVPAGKVDGRDHNPLDTVNRELNEETRLTAGKIEKDCRFLHVNWLC